MSLTYNENDKELIVFCDNCYRNIISTVRIRCGCTLDLCILCFISADEHTLHEYHVIDFCGMKIDGWCCVENFLFYEGLVLNGIGNWEDISYYLKTKDLLDVERYFLELFNIRKNNKYESDNLPTISDPEGYNTVFSIKRKDFEYEDIMGLEDELKDMGMGDDNNIYEEDGSKMNNHDLIQKINIGLLNGYIDCLNFRDIKNYLIIERELYDVKKLKKIENKLEDWEMEILNKMKPLIYYLNKKDFDIFYGGLCIEEYLIRRLHSFTENKKEMGVFAKERLYMGILDEEEKKLCKQLNISYGNYMKIKKYFILHKIGRKRVRYMVKGKDERIYVLYNFFKKNKWL
ncbi:Transcriptional adapter [Spraguea lophii 42_110]|uniref:Transcriptional adapter n=1 Tax=Spraguea lophii (strain 42_110) TaxID=1358809 RepID=S7W991_SPRLO|nr:Transcriptional adapter [Spraguea lophii 42_110]